MSSVCNTFLTQKLTQVLRLYWNVIVLSFSNFFHINSKFGTLLSWLKLFLDLTGNRDVWMRGFTRLIVWFYCTLDKFKLRSLFSFYFYCWSYFRWHVTSSFFVFWFFSLIRGGVWVQTGKSGTPTDYRPQWHLWRVFLCFFTRLQRRACELFAFVVNASIWACCASGRCWKVQQAEIKMNSGLWLKLRWVLLPWLFTHCFAALSLTSAPGRQWD